MTSSSPKYTKASTASLGLKVGAEATTFVSGSWGWTWEEVAAMHNTVRHASGPTVERVEHAVWRSVGAGRLCGWVRVLMEPGPGRMAGGELAEGAGAACMYVPCVIG